MELRIAILEDGIPTEELDEGRKPQIGPNVQKILEKRQSPTVTPQQEAYYKKIEEVKDFITESGGDPESPDFAVAAEYAVSGMFAVAKREAEQVIKGLKEKPVENKETEEQRIERTLFP